MNLDDCLLQTHSPAVDPLNRHTLLSVDLLFQHISPRSSPAVQRSYFSFPKEPRKGTEKKYLISLDFLLLKIPAKPLCVAGRPFRLGVVSVHNRTLKKPTERRPGAGTGVLRTGIKCGLSIFLGFCWNLYSSSPRHPFSTATLTLCKFLFTRDLTRVQVPCKILRSSHFVFGVGCCIDPSCEANQLQPQLGALPTKAHTDGVGFAI